MSNQNTFVSITAILLAVCAAGSGWAGYSYYKGEKADRFYLAEAAALNSAAIQAVYVSERAATDSSYTREMVGFEDEVEKRLALLRSGDSVKGIPGLPETAQGALRTFQESWDGITPNIAKIAGSKSNTEVFTRNVQETVRQAATAMANGTDAQRLVQMHSGVSKSAKDQLSEAYSDLSEAVDLISRNGPVNADSLRTAETAIGQYLGTMTAVGNSLPRDNSILEPLLKSYRAAQATQRALAKTLESSTNTVENLPHAREIWKMRDRITAASTALQVSVTALSESRPISVLVVAGAGLLTIIVALMSFVVVIRATDSRAKNIDSQGNSIQASQRDRTHALQTLVTEIRHVAKGDLTTVLTDDRESTKEIASELNTAFGRIREILYEANSTIVGLAAAAEQTLMTAQDVGRGRAEQFQAIEHVVDLLTKLGQFTSDVETLISKTKGVSLEVAHKVQSGTESVSQVHEGIILLNQHNSGIQHQSKALIESFQALEGIAKVVSSVAEKSGLVSYNAYLVAEQIDNPEVSRRITRSAEAMSSLANESKVAVNDIALLLRTMNDAARDTQHAVDNSQREIESLLNRSNTAQESLGSINLITQTLNNSVEEVSNHTQDLRQQSQEVNNTMNTIQRYAVENSAASEQTAAAIQGVNKTAQDLSRVIAQWKLHN